MYALQYDPETGAVVGFQHRPSATSIEEFRIRNMNIEVVEIDQQTFEQYKQKPLTQPTLYYKPDTGEIEDRTISV